MQKFPAFVLVALLLGAAGCSPSTGTLKGSLVDGGKPVGSEGQQVSLSFYAVNPDGSADEKNCSTAVLNADGTFEFIASGGTLAPGKYKVVIASAGNADVAPPPNAAGATMGKAKKKSDKNDRFAGHSSLSSTKLMLTVEAGKNEVVIDLSKPAG